MRRRLPRSTRTDTLFPSTTLFRSYTRGGTEQTFPLRIAPPMPSFPVAHSVQIDEKTVPASPLFAMFDARAHHEEQPFARHDRGRHVGCGGRPRERRQIDRKSTRLNSSH